MFFFPALFCVAGLLDYDSSIFITPSFRVDKVTLHSITDEQFAEVNVVSIVERRLLEMASFMCGIRDAS